MIIESISGDLDECSIPFIKNTIKDFKNDINKIIEYCENNVEHIPIIIESLIDKVKYHSELYSISKFYIDYYNKLN